MHIINSVFIVLISDNPWGPCPSRKITALALPAASGFVLIGHDTYEWRTATILLFRDCVHLRFDSVNVNGLNDLGKRK